MRPRCVDRTRGGTRQRLDLIGLVAGYRAGLTGSVGRGEAAADDEVMGVLDHELEIAVVGAAQLDRRTVAEVVLLDVVPARAFGGRNRITDQVKPEADRGIGPGTPAVS